MLTMYCRQLQSVRQNTRGYINPNSLCAVRNLLVHLRSPIYPQLLSAVTIIAYRGPITAVRVLGQPLLDGEALTVLRGYSSWHGRHPGAPRLDPAADNSLAWSLDLLVCAIGRWTCVMAASSESTHRPRAREAQRAAAAAGTSRGLQLGNWRLARRRLPPRPAAVSGGVWPCTYKPCSLAQQQL